MKKTLLAASALILASTSAQSVERFPKWYIGLSAGVADQRDSDVKTAGGKGEISWDSGYVASAALGYQPDTSGFRFELEGSQHKQDTGKNVSGDVKVNNVAINVLYDFTNDSVITPYVGLGLGYAKFDLESGALSDSDSKLTYQGLVGLGYEPQTIPNVGFSLGYRYFAPFSDPEVGTGAAKTEFEYDNHSVELGAKFRF